MVTTSCILYYYRKTCSIQVLSMTTMSTKPGVILLLVFYKVIYGNSWTLMVILEVNKKFIMSVHPSKDLPKVLGPGPLKYSNLHLFVFVGKILHINHGTCYDSCNLTPRIWIVCTKFDNGCRHSVPLSYRSIQYFFYG